MKIRSRLKGASNGETFVKQQEGSTWANKGMYSGKCVEEIKARGYTRIKDKAQSVELKYSTGAPEQSDIDIRRVF